MFRYDGSDAEQRAAGLTHALAAAKRGELVALNLDGAYAVLTDAFSHLGVERLRVLKGRASMNVPVLVPRADTVDGIAMLAGESGVIARTLMRDCWPGPLTLLARSQPSLPWTCTPDGVVAVRMPMHPWTLELLRATGPAAAVPSHAPEQQPHADADAVVAAIGDQIAVLLDGGPCLADQSSTIVDVAGPDAVMVREGAFSRAHLAALTQDLLH